MEKIPVIYILSNGRSGSTLLDLLLGSYQNVWTLGEAQNLPWEVRANRPSGSGKPIQECPFWKPLLPRIPLDKGNYPIELFRLGESGKVIRWELLSGLYQGKIPPYYQDAVREYGKLNYTYFREVWEAAQKERQINIEWLVDASKDPYRLFWLQHSGLFNIKVIHLTKIPPAFVYSTSKYELPKATKKVIRMSGRWLVENTIMSLACHSNIAPNSFTHLRYEDLARQPDEALQKVSNCLGITLKPKSETDFRSMNNYAVSGNKMRWQNTPIKLDEKWRSCLPQKYQQMVWILTGLTAKKYGY